MGTFGMSALALGAAAVTSAACGTAGAKDAPASAPAAKRAAVTVSARLKPSAELRKGDPDGRGTVSITLNAALGKACWRFSVSGLTRPLSAHVHEGAPGKEGPVVIPLGSTYVKQGCVIAPKRTIRAVANHPAAYYVNIHTRKYLNGAIRGQLR